MEPDNPNAMPADASGLAGMNQGHEGMSQGHEGAVRGRAVGSVEGMQRAQAGGMDPSALPKIMAMLKAALAQTCR